jgi:two-component system, response regulator
MDSTIILLVGNDPADAGIIMKSLKGARIANNILHLENEQKTLDFLFGGKENQLIPENKPKVILLDPDTMKDNGVGLLHKLKQDDQTKNIPVVILTSYRKEEALKKYYEYGINSYLVKPLTVDEFIKIVTEIGSYWLLSNHTSF